MRLPTQILRTVINFPRPAISTVKKSRDNILKLGKALVQERQDALTQGLETNSDALSNLSKSFPSEIFSFQSSAILFQFAPTKR